MPETAIELRELHEMASEALYWDNPARIKRVWNLKTQWIPYTRAEFLIHKAEELLNRPKAPRLPCLLVYADPNSGKTALLKRYGELHPIDSNRGGDAIRAPVISIEIRSPDEGALYDSILKAIQAPFKIQDRVQKKRNQILTILEKIGTRQLLLDELNTAISGPLLKQRNFLVALKNLLNEIQMTVFATGTPDARIALAPDQQLESRFEMEELRRWTYGEEFRQLLESFECRLPLREPSELQAPIFAKRIHELTEGYIGEIAELLMRVAVKAIETKKERIDCRLLAELNWKPPLQRRGEARGLHKTLAGPSPTT
ncbi:TniB family NTP-binding protein [Tunturiibacter gelidoferens]|uniref:TniB family NTP-binding protein n=1 Tax=Tunturiibacter gelidiferens TaxID=3069689 RepID=UPI00160E828D|nr:TniB family NTP-binding protein [Edaphobacter lichenicola]